MHWQRLDRLAAQSWSITVPGVAGAILRLALLRWLPVPLPNAPDEFSYLLGADTFSHGRLANPTHPLWRFFETVHVISVPTYASKYPPGQAFFLAMGERFFGQPFFGSLIAYVLMITALVWMLRAWTPPIVAFLTGCAAALAFGPGHSWIESYWGGTVSAVGAALVLGAIGRMRSEQRFGHAWSLAGGNILLWFTRPYEGIFFVAAAIIVLLRDATRRRFQGFASFAVILIGCGTATLAWQAHYNRRVTGDPLLLPYVLHQRQYDYEPPLWIEAPRTPTLDTDSHIRYFHEVDELGTYRERRRLMLGWLTDERPSGQVRPMEMKDRLKVVESVIILVMLTGFGIANRTDRDVRVLGFIAVTSLAAIVLETFVMDHYMGPLDVAVIALAARVIWLSSGRRPRVSAACVAMLLTMALGNNAFRAWRAARHTMPFPANRSRVDRELAARDGRHVVIVRYAADHDAGQSGEWVYNSADIDAQKVIWARDLGPITDQRLIDYYRGRRFWILDADADRPEPVPYGSVLATQQLK